MLAAEVEPGELPVQAVDEGHPLRDVDRELDRRRSVHNQPVKYGSTLVILQFVKPE